MQAIQRYLLCVNAGSDPKKVYNTVHFFYIFWMFFFFNVLLFLDDIFFRFPNLGQTRKSGQDSFCDFVFNHSPFSIILLFRFPNLAQILFFILLFLRDVFLTTTQILTWVCQKKLKQIDAPKNRHTHINDGSTREWTVSWWRITCVKDALYNQR